MAANLAIVTLIVVLSLVIGVVLGRKAAPQTVGPATVRVPA